MAWAKIDDRLYAHPKILRVSLGARGLWLTAFSYAAGLERDGWFPFAALPLFLPGNAVSNALSSPNADAYVNELLSEGLWIRVEDGYRFHDFLRYNRSSKELKRQRKHGAKRLQAYRKRHGKGNAVTNALVTPTPARPGLNIKKKNSGARARAFFMDAARAPERDRTSSPVRLGDVLAAMRKAAP